MDPTPAFHSVDLALNFYSPAPSPTYPRTTAPAPARPGYRFGVPEESIYEEVLNTDAAAFGGSNVLNPHPVASAPLAAHGRRQSIVVTLPPLAVAVFRKQR